MSKTPKIEMTQPTKFLTHKEVFDIAWDHAQTFPDVADAIWNHVQRTQPEDFEDAADYLQVFSQMVDDVFQTPEQVIESLIYTITPPEKHNWWIANRR